MQFFGFLGLGVEYLRRKRVSADIRAAQANFSNGVMYMKIRTDVQKSGQILEKNFFYENFFQLRFTKNS